MTALFRTKELFGGLLILAALFVLETARHGVAIETVAVGETPVTRLSVPAGDGPVVVVAHGFAGSSQMMLGYALPLARAGYRVHVLDFLGHGRHPVPMSGDVTSVDGTTRLLVDQVIAVIEAVGPENGKVALVGHSMATDVLVRVAAERADVGPVVLLSAFSRAIDATQPETLLLVTGAWEPGLTQFAAEALRMVDPNAEEGDTVSRGNVTRRAAVAPLTEHVSILHSRVARREAVDWLDRAYGRASDVFVYPTGPAIIALLAGLVLLFGAVARVLPAQDVPVAELSRRQFLAVVAVPMIAAPMLAAIPDTRFLPVLVADYLALHLAVYGLIQLALLGRWGIASGPFAPAAFAVLIFGACLLGFALDRYAANFWPTPERGWIIAAMLIGAAPFFIADARLAHHASGMRRLILRAAFLASLGLAVTLDFEGLFFLLMIAPVIVLFYLVFGTMGRAVSVRSGPLATGLALGLVLAWTLGVSFPLFKA